MPKSISSLFCRRGLSWWKAWVSGNVRGTVGFSLGRGVGMDAAGVEGLGQAPAAPRRRCGCGGVVLPQPCWNLGLALVLGKVAGVSLLGP